MAEAIAVHQAVSLAVFSNVRSLAVLSDSLSLVNLLNKGETQPELFADLVAKSAFAGSVTNSSVGA
ncbi:hypothetical protein IGI04_017854 [Brassica rapa subsp. trilocularis]|uniref:RNase H type-1 domain-containing protein n=1 Tax=Brassica rapa subsp. trilocularis TaxID=1813537 RepID=A0ABQ7MDP0_BRACM|nr:hypothetical protein IGI04_017854 [Brassica rapa subsp. trilocularis]